MKQALIYGDLTSDRAGEQYPTVSVCDDCIKKDKAKEAEGRNRIVSIVGDEDDADGPCELCGCEGNDA